MFKLAYFMFLFTLIACGDKARDYKTRRLNLSDKGQTSIVLLGVADTQQLKANAVKLGIKVEGDHVVRLSGDAETISFLDIPVANNFAHVKDEVILENQNKDFGKISNDSLYLAKKDFGILEFWKKNPTADGRGVTVGVLDDGISPNQTGFQLTTTGERKFLKKGSQSSMTTFPLVEKDGFLEATIVEELGWSQQKLDLNQDGNNDSWSARVMASGKTVCLDLDHDKNYSPFECKGTFDASGDYFSLPKKPEVVIMAEVDLKDKKLRLFQPEMDDDSHGEGVASVLAGHNLGGLSGFDGVAPGAKILDYDLSEQTNVAKEQEYTIGTFLLGLDWLGKNGAEVANISYSLFFTSAESQTFMAQAIKELVTKYNMVISFSAGNNGPGLGSMNRYFMYSSSVLVAGAYVSKELDERVHGVTGLPEEGRVVYYSSRGPGAQGLGPLLISPLSSLTHSSSNEGYSAFSGTSSASPALAGAATVLISALKQAGLKVDAPTVVHALRLSGKQLKNEPFVAQGFGLPQVEKAFEIYKDLIAGKSFLHIISAVNRPGYDKIAPESIVVKKSEARSTETYSITFSGEVSSLASAEARVNLLVPVDVAYSKGITGPRELWISQQSSMNVDVHIDEILDGQNEGFGEIRLYSKLNKSLMAVIPVTAINDQRVGRFLRQTLAVSAQEGSRLHLNVPAGVSSLRIRPRVVEGEKRSLIVRAYDPTGIDRYYSRIGNEFYLPTPKAGHYQVTLSMRGGTKSGAVVEFEMEEMSLYLKTKVVSKIAGSIQIFNTSSAPMSGNILLTKKDAPLKARTFNLNETSPEVILSLGKGSYSVRLLSAKEHDFAYDFSACTISKQVAPDKFEPVGELLYVNNTDQIETLKFRCVPFEYGMGGIEDYRWQLKVMQRVSLAPIPMLLDYEALSTVTLPNLEEGTYEVGFLPDFTLGRTMLNLGTLEVSL